MSGTIDAGGVDPFIIDTGSNTVTNAGTLAAMSGSDLAVAGNLANSGLLVADGGTITVGGIVTGAGKAVISSGGEVEFASASTNNVTFVSGSTGELVLDDATAYSGVISDFATNQSIDLADIPTTAKLVSFVGGILTISGGSGDVAHLHIAGAHTLGDFSLAPDGGTGAILKDPEVQSATTATPADPPLTNVIAASKVALFGNYIAALFASADGQVTTPMTMETGQIQFAIAHPHSG
jgi:Haemagluttinin repeat